jgi:plasmid stability protein
MTKKIYPSDKQEQFMVRFPDGLRDRIRVAAEKNNRSMNAEIVSRLEASFAPTPRDNIEKLPIKTQLQIREFVNS